MFDKNLLFADEATVSTNGQSSVITINGTPSDGVKVEVAVSTHDRTSGNETLDIVVQEGETTNGTFYDLVTFAQITGTGRWTRQVQSKMKCLRLDYTVGGTTPSTKLTAGIVTGAPIDQVADQNGP